MEVFIYAMGVVFGSFCDLYNGNKGFLRVNISNTVPLCTTLNNTSIYSDRLRLTPDQLDIYLDILHKRHS